MRINILTPIPFWHPGTNELIQGLRQHKFEVVSTDIWELRIIDHKGKFKQIIPNFFPSALKRIIRRLLRIWFIKNYIRSDDIVDIQWCGHYYSKYIGSIKKQNVRIIATLFGSDLLRNTIDEKKKQLKIFEAADIIVMGENMQSEFEKYFHGLSEKIKFNQYGSKRIDIVCSLNSVENKILLRKKYGIRENQLAVTIGYNAKPEQQHLEFIKILNHLNIPKEQLFLILPLTYGKNDLPGYLEKLKNEVIHTGFDYLFIENKLSDQAIAETKIISDITVNLQTTDALASSIKEAFAASNILLAGDWLPYQIYRNIGIFFISAGMHEFGEKFIDIIHNIQFYQQKCKSNPQKIVDFASWDKILPVFVKTYNDLYNERNK